MEGKDNLISELKSLLKDFKKICIIVDGAGFGSSMDMIISFLKVQYWNDIYLLLPESFEYLLLESGAIEVDKDILEKTRK